ncbi:polysaccharide biosynthesis tyrosine autokinase [Arthrobacter sp. PAMC25564]|uniref:polysaccharide biosynthesis tyrosine autokinase n=1 Tax=Arthrobacter sp. PAMC25564 TaxID=2565366 RepID=UPI0010A26B5B|nr:polysaccharide biosynthesis tyrosine autokinase [Arthrobacter sp. PAMC25564]QCB96551.1 polysaccharide biosynthesis tyrosine autokinase [Arthrobacter sp. PAMC25564]
MELRDYLRILRRNWILIVSLALVGVIGGAASSLLIRPTYTAETQLFVAIQNSGTVQELQQGNTFSQARVQSYTKTVDTPVVLQPVIDTLGLGMTSKELSAKVKATSDLNTVLITISASDGSPVQAAAIAQAVGDSLIKAVDALERSDKTSSSPVKLSIVTPAVAPREASAPNTRLNLALGLLAGLVFGAGTTLLRTTLDNKIRGEADLRRVTNAPMLGGIAFDRDAVKKPLITQAPNQSPRAESFRQIRTNMQFANLGQKSGAVMVTSSLPGEGKSTTATNLAITLAQAGQSVVLVDADLRRPMIAEYLGLEGSAGLTTALIGNADVQDLLQPWGDDQLFVLTSGNIPPNPSELLGSDAMLRMVRQLESTFDSVIIDAPPLLPVTDAAVLSQHLGGVILIVGSQRVRQGDVEKSLGALELVGSNVLGIVMNMLPSKGADAYAYSYQSYGSYDAEAKRSLDSEIPTAHSRPPTRFPRSSFEANSRRS